MIYNSYIYEYSNLHDINIQIKISAKFEFAATG